MGDPVSESITADVFRLPLRPFIGIVSKTIATTCLLAPAAHLFD
ncbi:UNVERIFIED_ORG: hypothetical protein GGE64_001402 [Rhizobium etli]|nr:MULTISPECIES: hypothetical protein [Rhizobium]UWU38388.1 hypothetical protein N2597_30310 [Rhizobium leguminosarum bv. phaseoli]